MTLNRQGLSNGLHFERPFAGGVLPLHVTPASARIASIRRAVSLQVPEYFKSARPTFEFMTLCP